MPLDALLQEARGMTDDTIMEVIHYMQFLKIAPMRKTSYTVTPTSKSGESIYRKPGLYKDQIKIAEGFDEALDDFKEYM